MLLTRPEALPKKRSKLEAKLRDVRCASFDLLPLDENSARTLLWSHLAEHPRAEELVSIGLRQDETLWRRPLMATFLAHYLQDVPEGRSISTTTVVAYAMDALLREVQDVAGVDPRLARPVLRRVAFAAQEKGHRVLGQRCFLGATPDGDVDAREVPQILWDTSSRRHLRILEPIGGSLQFSHLLGQEFLAAEEFVDRLIRREIGFDFFYTSKNDPEILPRLVHMWRFACDLLQGRPDADFSSADRRFFCGLGKQVARLCKLDMIDWVFKNGVAAKRDVLFTGILHGQLRVVRHVVDDATFVDVLSTTLMALLCLPILPVILMCILYQRYRSETQDDGCLKRVFAAPVWVLIWLALSCILPCVSILTTFYVWLYVSWKRLSRWCRTRRLEPGAKGCTLPKAPDTDVGSATTGEPLEARLSPGLDVLPRV